MTSRTTRRRCSEGSTPLPSGRSSRVLAGAVAGAVMVGGLSLGVPSAAGASSGPEPSAVAAREASPLRDAARRTSGESPSGSAKVAGYFTEWGIYGRNYHVKNIDTSGAAQRMTHVVYAFGNVENGKCVIADSYADYGKVYSAADSVDGVADPVQGEALRGNFGQLRRLKAKYPGLKVLWSFGGWTGSPGFTQAAEDPDAFALSCRALVEDPRWADVFDGIDIDWEYPNACGLVCDTSGRDAYTAVMAALRQRFGADLVTSAITADTVPGGKFRASDYVGAARYVDWYMPMTYDFFGTWNPTGPTAPHSPLTSYPGIPQAGADAASAIAWLKKVGIPAKKIMLGVGFYGRGWTGVTQETPGGSATGPARGTYEAGVEAYNVLVGSCPVTGTVGGTAYAHCGTDWWGYDTPGTITQKMAFVRSQSLAGAFFWELSGDTASGDLVRAVGSGLSTPGKADDRCSGRIPCRSK